MERYHHIWSNTRQDSILSLETPEGGGLRKYLLRQQGPPLWLWAASAPPPLSSEQGSSRREGVSMGAASPLPLCCGWQGVQRPACSWGDPTPTPAATARETRRQGLGHHGVSMLLRTPEPTTPSYLLARRTLASVSQRQDLASLPSSSCAQQYSFQGPGLLAQGSVPDKEPPAGYGSPHPPSSHSPTQCPL